jgi:hypothetical protein
MRVQFVGLKPHQVEIVCELLDATGHEYEVDFQALYGPGWTLCGIEVMNLALVPFVWTTLSIMGA